MKKGPISVSIDTSGIDTGGILIGGISGKTSSVDIVVDLDCTTGDAWI